MKTLSSPILVPPNKPPRTRNAAADAESWREPRRHQNRVRIGFVIQVMSELRRVVWPTKSEVCAASVVTLGILGFFAAYIHVLKAAGVFLFGLLGLR